MIIELNEKNDLLIQKLEQSFPCVYNNNQIKEEYQNNPYTRYLIYQDKDSEILAFLHYDKIYDRYEISNFQVKEENRRNHIGSKLLNFCITKAKEEKMDNITLEVRKNNIPAINLYHKYKFKDCAIRKKYYNDEDGILMILDLKKI